MASLFLCTAVVPFQELFVRYRFDEKLELALTHQECFLHRVELDRRFNHQRASSINCSSSCAR